MKKISSLMLLALVLLLSCRTDQFPEKEAYNNTSAFQLTSKQISLNESKHKSKLLIELERAKAELKKLKTDALGKTVTYGNGVSIDTDNVVYIENGPNYHTYTFTITRENATADAPLENLVLSPLTDGTYRELLFTYNLNSVEKDNIANGIPVDPKGRVSVTELTKGTYNTDGQLAKTSCNWVETTIWIPCSSDDHHDGSNYWECEFVTSPNTANGTPPRAVVIEEYKCLLESDPGLGDGPGGSGPGSSDDGGGEGGTDPDDEPCNGNGVLTEPQQPGLTNPNGCTGIPTMPPTLATSFSMIVRSLPSEVKILLNSNTAFYNGLNNYYTANQTPQGENFVRWAAQFSWENQNVTWAQFQNWFMTQSEGQDGEYIANLDDVLNSIQYQTKQMPTYSQFVSAFPKLNYTGYPGYYLKLPAAQVYPIIGGDLENLYNDKKDNGPFRNACAARWSLGMNGAGILIPNNSVSIKGADVNGQPRYYIVNSEAAGSFMQKTFGNPTHKLEGADANNSNKIANFLKGKTGIYVVTNNNPVDAGYYGHIDLIQNGHVPGGANVDKVIGGIKSIRIWEFTP